MFIRVGYPAIKNAASPERRDNGVPKPPPDEGESWRFRVLGAVIPEFDDLVAAKPASLPTSGTPILPLYLRPIETDIAGFDLRIGERREPYSTQHALLMQIPGVDWVVAAVQIAQTGVDMSVFLSVYHLAAWAGVCPGNHESAGRQKSGRGLEGQRPPERHPGRRRDLRVGKAPK